MRWQGSERRARLHRVASSACQIAGINKPLNADAHATELKTEFMASTGRVIVTVVAAVAVK